MSNIKTKIEQFKNVMIVVLFITSILLLSFFWRGLAWDGLKNMSLGNDDSKYKPKTYELVVPEYIKVGLGSERYALIDIDTVLPDSEGSEERKTIYKKLINIMSEYIMQEEINVEEIEKSQYNEVMAYATISAEFGFQVPFREYIRQNEIIKSGISHIDDMTTITMSPFSSENIFICNKSTGDFYRIMISDEKFSKRMANTLNELITSFDSEANASYYTIKNVAGADNDAMIPIYLTSSLKELPFRSEFSINDRSDVIEAEQIFFSDGMDFVRRITENKGSLIYIFGYNEKVLTLNENGSINYKEEFDRSSYVEQNLYETIETAIEYVSRHGGWKSISDAGGDPYLKEVKKINQGNGKYSGYRLVFGIKVRGVPLEYGNSDIIAMDICGSQVIAYERDLIIPEYIDTTENWNAVVPLDFIITNYKSMYDTIIFESKEGNDKQNIAEFTREEQFDHIMSKIDKVEFCMYRNFDANMISPKWLVRVDDIDFIFDPHEGIFEGYVLAEAE